MCVISVDLKMKPSLTYFIIVHTVKPFRKMFVLCTNENRNNDLFPGKAHLYFDDQDKDTFFCQLILNLEKFHIHKIKWAKSKPNIVPFRHELHHYAATIKDIRNKKAAKTYSIVEKFCASDL